MDIETIWLAYRANLQKFLLSKVANVADVDDLLQEILIKSHQHLAELNDQQRIQAWLFQIAQRTVIDFYRRKGGAAESLSEEFAQADVEDDIYRELQHCLTPLLANVDQESAQLLMAIDLEGLSQKQYAAQLDISYSTLKSRVQKSRQQLAKVFSDCCHYSVDSKGHLIDYAPKSKNCRC